MKIIKRYWKYILYASILICTISFMIYGYFNKFDRPGKLSEPGAASIVLEPISKDAELSQEFIVRQNILDRISIIFVNYAKELTGGEMTIELYNEKKKMIFHEEYSLKDLPDNSNINMDIEKISNSNGKKFEIKIKVEEMVENESFSFYAEPNNELKLYKLNNKKAEKTSSSISIYQNGIYKSYYYVIFTFVSLLIELFVGVLLFAKEKKFTKRQQLVQVVLSIACSVIMAYALAKVFYNIFTHDSLGRIVFPVLVITSALEMMLLAYKIKYENKNIAKLFVYLAIPLGALYCVCIVPGTVPDEPYHARMVYSVTSGQFNTLDIKIPDKLKRVYYSYGTSFASLKDKSYKIEDYYGNRYWFVMYLGGAIGYTIGRICSLSVLGCLYCGCFINYLIFVAIGYYIISKMPFGKYLALVYMLSPMYLQQATSVSCDAFINAVCLLFIAHILDIYVKKGGITTKDFVLVCTFGVLSAICKFAYFPLLILFILIKDKLIKYFKKSKKNKKNVGILLLCLAVFVIGTLVYLKHYDHIYDNHMREISISDTKYPNIEISKIGYTIEEFSRVPYVVLNTLFQKSDFYALSFAGQSLGWFDINMPIYLTIMMYILYVISTFFDAGKYDFDTKSKIITLLCWTLCLCVVFGGLYIYWGELKDLFVEGVQGRYFIPFNILLFLLFSSKKIKFDIDYKSFILAIPLILINIYTIMCVIMHYL